MDAGVWKRAWPVKVASDSLQLTHRSSRGMSADEASLTFDSNMV